MTHLLKVRRNGRVYLYECVTFRIEGSDTPRTDRIYIGSVGPDGRFRSKKYHVKETIDLETLDIRGGLRDLPRVPPCYEGLREFTSSMGSASRRSVPGSCRSSGRSPSSKGS